MIPLDQPTRLTFSTFSDAAKSTPADPTTVSLYVKDWTTGTTTTYTWAGATVTRDSLGVFHWDAPDSAAGTLQWRWKATGAVATSTKAGLLTVGEAFPAALVSLEDAKAALNKVTTTDNDELQDLIYAASAILLGLPTHRIADVCQVQTYTEWVDAGSEALLLKHYPITAVTSVTEYDGTTTQAIAAEPIDGGTFTGYGWDYADGTGANGMLVRLSSGYPVCWSGRRVKVVYTAGSGSVPLDVRDAALKLVKHLWADQRGSGAGRAIPGESPEAVYLPDVSPHLLPLDVEQALSRYKRDLFVA